MWEITRDSACTLVIYMMEPPHGTKPVLMGVFPAASDVREVHVWVVARMEEVRRSNCSMPGETMERRVCGCDNVGGSMTLGLTGIRTWNASVWRKSPTRGPGVIRI